jgi:PAS domain S-box-containing protein
MSTLIDPLWDTIAVLDEHGVIVSVNKVWRDFAESNGGSAVLASGVGLDYLAVVRRAAGSDVLAAAALQGLEEVLNGQQSMFTLEYPCHSPDRERWFELYATPSATGVIVGHRDISTRKQALAQSAAQRGHHRDNLSAVLNSVSSMIGYWDRHLRNRFANHAYRDWFGIDPATIPGKHIREVIGEERYRLNLPYIEAALRGSAQQFERAIPSPDGRSVRHALARYIPDMVDGEVDGFFVEVTDVTSVKAGEEALQRAQEVGRLGSYTTDLSSGVWVGSPMLDRIFGIGPEYEHNTAGWERLLHADDRQATLDGLRHVVATGAAFDIEYRIVRPGDGAVRWMHGLGRVERTEMGTPLRLLGTVQDITERKLAERATQVLLDQNTRLVRQLMDTQERERVALARELHDELAQHLTAIRAFAAAIQRDKATPHERILAAARAIDVSARDIYEVSHRLMEGLHPSILDAGCISEAVGSLLAGWGQQHPEIEWRASLAAGLMCDGPRRLAIYRIVQECLSNIVRHARAERVRIVLATRRGPDGGRLRLVIRDDGIGMDVGAAQTGFGLLGMRERVLSLGGSLQISSGRGAGTRVRVLLPGH